jgi:hypothetical protein
MSQNREDDYRGEQQSTYQGTRNAIQQVDFFLGVLYFRRQLLNLRVGVGKIHFHVRSLTF